jgi:hypothetical protein
MQSRWPLFFLGRSVWFLALVLWAGLSCGLAFGQENVLEQPRLYTVPNSVSPPPSFVLTGSAACVLAWPPGAYASTEQKWRMRVLDAATLTPKVEVSIGLEANLTPVQSSESLDGKGSYILFTSTKNRQIVVLMYFRYTDGVTEAERFSLPLDVEIQQLLVSSAGAYVRGEAEGIPYIFFLDLESRRGQVLPFGPDKANHLLGCGIERATGQFWLGVARKGGNPGPTPVVVRFYAQGQALAEQPLEGFTQEESPTALYLMGDSVQGLWIGYWGRRGTDVPQGAFSMQGFRVKQKPRFVDSLRYFYFEKPSKAARQHSRLSKRTGFVLSYKYINHQPMKNPTSGTYRLAAERYYMRQTSNNTGGFMMTMGPMGFPTSYSRYFETDFATTIDISPAGEIVQLKSFTMPEQTFDDLKLRAMLLPDRPPLCLERSAPKMGLPDPEDPAKLNWQVLQPSVLGLPEGHTVSVQRLVEEPPMGYAFGTGKDAAHNGYFFLARLPQGK